MSIIEFLLARIAEDEAEAGAAVAERERVFGDDPRSSDPDMSLQSWPDVGVPAVLVGPERVLAECAAKRRIVEWADEFQHSNDGDYVLRELAAVYADYPDYDQAWAL